MRARPILVIEDSTDDSELIVRSLHRCNLANEILVARDGPEALAMLHDGTPLAPALVLLDLKLPKMDGLSVLKRIREHPHTRFVPIVILTASTDDSDALAAYDLGANSHIRKPVKFEDFVRTVGQLGLYWTICNLAPRG